MNHLFKNRGRHPSVVAHKITNTYSYLVPVWAATTLFSQMFAAPRHILTRHLCSHVTAFKKFKGENLKSL